MEVEMGRELRQEGREAKAIHKDIATARGLIQDALNRYLKKKVGARNKKQLEDQAALFAEVEQFSCQEEIRDHYGWAWITENEMRRLLDLWDAQEVARENAGRYTDRVTELLRRAMDKLGEEYLDLLSQADNHLRQFEADLERIERENAQHTYERRQAALQRELRGGVPDAGAEHEQDCSTPEEAGGFDLRP